MVRANATPPPTYGAASCDHVPDGTATEIPSVMQKYGTILWAGHPATTSYSVMTDLERLRKSFKPESIRALFVGESPPHSGKSFYRENTVLYREMKKAFGKPGEFLVWFKARGYFLDDLVLHPINQFKDECKRRKVRVGAIESLARRVARYRPAAVVVVKCAIEPRVRDAMRQGELPDTVPIYVTPFPSFGNQKRFHTKMAEIIPKLPSS